MGAFEEDEASRSLRIDLHSLRIEVPYSRLSLDISLNSVCIEDGRVLQQPQSYQAKVLTFCDILPSEAFAELPRPQRFRKEAQKQKRAL